MNTLFKIKVIIVLCLSSFVVSAQNFVIFKGTIGTADSAFYCFDNDRSTQQRIHADTKGNYTLRLKLNYESSISFYYSQGDCEQVLDLKKVKDFIKETKCQTLQNDLTSYQAVNCVQKACSIPDSNKVFTGDYKSLDTRTLLIFDCTYKSNFAVNEFAYCDEGFWTVNDKVISFKSIGIKNILTGTYKSTNTTSTLRFENDKLIKLSGDVDFIKK